MALDPEELKKRRAQREAQRKQQRAKTRRIVLLVTVAAVVLAAVVIGIILIAGSGGRAEENARPEQPTQPTRPAGEVTTIHFAAAGDLNINDQVVAAGGSEQDYTNTFLDVAHVLGQADVAALNFEGVLVGAPYGSSKSAPVSMLDALADAGVDILQLANSYSIYKGVSGLGTTIENVQAAGLTPLGVYANRQAYKEGKGYVICQVQGIKLAFVAFTKGMDGMALPAGSENCVNVLYTDYASAYQEVDTEGIHEILEAVEKEKPDITVAMVHWGSEFNDTLSSSQEEIRDVLLAGGVNAIIGTHSHYVQKMEFDKENNTFVAYSLGDFMGDAQRSGSEYSVILDLEITKDNKSGTTVISDFSYTPIFTVAEEDQPLRVVRIDSAIAAYESGYIDRVSEETYNAMSYALTRIEKRISGE